MGRKSGGTLLRVAIVGAAAALVAMMSASGGAEAAFPGTNGKIIFQSDRLSSLGGPGLYTITPDGTAQKLPGTGGGDQQAVWSPDGSRIAFQSTTSTNDKEISVMNADGTGRQTITDTTLDRTEQEPAWSPDGSRIVFAANASGTDSTTDLELWTINSDGSGLTQLTNNVGGVRDTEPAWSPDGEQIAFVSEGRPGQVNSDVYVMDANPATSDALAVNLTPNNNTNPVYQYNDEDPNWSPDGSQIAYSTQIDVWKVNANGTGRTNLTGGRGGGSEPSWAPDNTSIAYVRADGTDRNIYRMDTDGTDPIPVDTTARGDFKPDWQPASPQCDVTGTPGDDNGTNAITGSPADETICGLGGNDTINGGGGEDVLMGGDGNDTLTAPSGATTINGGAGRDVASFAGSATPIAADLETDFVRRSTTQPLQGAALVSVEGVTGSSNDDSLLGSAAADTLTGGLGADTLLGSGGNDRMDSRDSVNRNDTVNAGSGKDRCVTDRREASIRGCE